MSGFPRGSVPPKVVVLDGGQEEARRLAIAPGLFVSEMHQCMYIMRSLNILVGKLLTRHVSLDRRWRIWTLIRDRASGSKVD